MKVNEERILYIIGLIIIVFLIIFNIILGGLHLKLEEVFPPCPLYSNTGFYCPGCGGTRAMISLLKGNILMSIYYNAFYVYIVIFGLLFMVSQTIEIITKGKVKGIKYKNIYMILPIIILVVQCIARNLIFLIWHIHII